MLKQLDLPFCLQKQSSYDIPDKKEQKYVLALKAPITTAVDDICKYFFIGLQRK